MSTLLWLVPLLPLLGFAVLFCAAGRLPRAAAGAVGVGSVALSAGCALAVTALYLHGLGLDHFGRGGVAHVLLWRWIAVGGFDPAVALRLDTLSLVMMLVVSFVGFLIHLYSTEFMANEEGYARFFCYMNLFVAAMLLLVLADNLLLLFLGWEGVGLCSYLLIGFWYRDEANGLAARKAFIVTRIGDTAFLIGLLLLATHLGTLDIGTLLARAQAQWPAGTPLATAAAALLLGGALGKSAQLPLQTWLPDAMAGPTPVSALIHAATMVTAGVYLIARMHVLYDLAPEVRMAVAAIGAATLLMAACAALTQHDLKRILAYSTISQIGYMFLALGVGAWTAAIFHFMSHAFFKALLFLSAGAVMMRIADEHDIFRMGGLRRALPLAFWSFLIGAGSLSALPLITAGFYSKDMILWGAWSAGGNGPVLWGAGILGALLTPIYSFRAVFVVFYGDRHSQPTGRPGLAVAIPLAVLSVLALTAGFLNIPPVLGNVPSLSRLLASVLPYHQEIAGSNTAQALTMTVASLVALIGVAIAYSLYGRGRRPARLMAWPLAQRLHRFWFSDWGLDWLYDRALVRPVLWATHLNRDDVVDAFYGLVESVTRLSHAALSVTENGRLRRYAAWITVGSLGAVAIAMWVA